MSISTKWIKCTPDKLNVELAIFKAETRMGFKRAKDDWSEIIIKDVVKDGDGYLIKYYIDWLYWKEI